MRDEVRVGETPMHSDPICDHILHLSNQEVHHAERDALDKGSEEVLLEVRELLTRSKTRKQGLGHSLV